VLQSADGMTSIAMLSATANKGEYWMEMSRDPRHVAN